VRTRRYFYGHTAVAGHTFDYHASPVRILIGRAIAVGLLIAYNLAGLVSPLISAPMAILFVAVIPWLIVAAQRFNARNTSYRNVRFNFTGTYGGAFKAFLLWPLAGVLTLGGLMPLAHRARNYFYINKHTFGGRPFATQFPAWNIYKIYLQALLMLIGVIVIDALAWESLQSACLKALGHALEPASLEGRLVLQDIWRFSPMSAQRLSTSVSATPSSTDIIG
jgi:uncharacterized membrane protein YjgN (DUF898 family)